MIIIIDLVEMIKVNGAVEVGKVEVVEVMMVEMAVEEVVTVEVRMLEVVKMVVVVAKAAFQLLQSFSSSSKQQAVY